MFCVGMIEDGRDGARPSTDSTIEDVRDGARPSTDSAMAGNVGRKLADRDINRDIVSRSNLTK